jgi:hypothetical protein
MWWRGSIRTGSQLVAACVGGLALWALLAVVLYYAFDAIASSGDEQEWDILALYAGAGIGFFVGVPLGAVAGVLGARRFLKEKAFYRETLLGAVAGMAVGALLGGALIVLSNSFGMDWWDQNTEIAVFPGIPFVVTVVAAVRASDWIRWWGSRSARKGSGQ